MMDVTPVVNLIGAFNDAGQKIAPALAALGFITSSLQLLVAHVIGSPRGQERMIRSRNAPVARPPIRPIGTAAISAPVIE